MKYFILFFSFLFSANIYAQDCTIVDFTMETGVWADEISWNVTDEFGNVVYESSIDYVNYTITTETTCIADGCYTINMFDTFGDGWNGAILTANWDNGGIDFELPQGEWGQSALPINTNDSCVVVGGNEIYGCTDPGASNYNPFATIDDGSCYYFNDSIPGCTDPAALNYNPWATIDDGSCEYPIECDEGQVPADLYVCVFSGGQDIGFEIVDEFGNVVYSQMGYDDFEIDFIDLCLEEGVCYTATLSNLAGPFGWYNGYYWINTGNIQISTGTLADGQETMSFDFSVDGTCGDILGCMDPGAINYNPAATIDDGSCYYPAENDLCEDAVSLVPNSVIVVDNTGAYQNEDIWGECWSFGSGEGEQTSVWYSFTTPDEEDFRIIIEALGDGTWTLTDTQFGLFEECGGEMIACDGNSGEGLLSKFDFECGMLEPNTEYLLIVDGYYGDAGTCLLSYTVTSECEDPVYGCTDPEALNYNPNASVDDGSCYYSPDSCLSNSVLVSFVAGSWAYEVSFEIVGNGAVVLSSDGINFENGGQYFFTGCAEDGCYTLNMYDSFGDGWNGGEIYLSVNNEFIAEGITIDSGDFGSYTFGINDPDCENGTEIYGCTDPDAWNYNPLATIDDGSCYYDTTNYDCMAMFELVSIDQENDIVYLANTSITTGNAEFIWDFGDGNFSYEEWPTHQYAEAGTYIVCLTVYDALNCISTYCDSVTYDPDGFTDGGVLDGFSGGNTGWWINVIEPGATGVEDYSEFEEFTVFPVPTSDILFINLQSEVDNNIIINITDLRGRVLSTIEHDGGGGLDVIDFNTSSLDAGTYIIEAVSDNVRSVTRFEVLR